MSKVKITDYGIVHCLVACEDCDWAGSDLTGLDSTKTKREVRQHVAKTGHTVNVEVGAITKYEPAK